MNRVASGLEIFLREPPAWAADARLGLLSHAPSVGPDLAGARELVARRFPGRLTNPVQPPTRPAGGKAGQHDRLGRFCRPRPRTCRW